MRRVITTDAPPGRWWYFLAPLVLLAGVGGGTGWLLHALLHPPAAEQVRFMTPGLRTVRVEKPGDFVLWHEAQTVMNGRVFDVAPELPHGMKLTLTHKPTARRIDMRPARGRRVIEGGTRHAVGMFRLDVPGDYELRVGGVPEERVLAFAPSRTGSIVVAFVGCAVLNLLGWIGGPSIFIWAYARRLRAARKTESGGHR